jgi:hypothetical protein
VARLKRRRTDGRRLGRLSGLMILAGRSARGPPKKEPPETISAE